MNSDMQAMNEKEARMEPDENKVGFDYLVELFEQTHMAMQTQAARSVDIALVVHNWLFGCYIVEFENGGADRAALYGEKLINRLSERLCFLHIKGISPTNLRKFRGFYQAYDKIQQTVCYISASRESIRNMARTRVGHPKDCVDTVCAISSQRD